MRDTHYSSWADFAATECPPIFGDDMYALIKELWPICRSITGNGVRETLSIISKHLPILEQVEVSTGTKCFDWQVPPEWNIRDAWIKAPNGEKILDFKLNNLHVLNYSTPIHDFVDLDTLKGHVSTLPEMPDAIPYVSSYYKERWGFCMTHLQLSTLKPGRYEVFIDSDLKNGSLTYGELYLPGQSEEEIFFSTYVCHPSMANNELSGPAVSTYLARWLMSKKNRRYSYRFFFGPETIGSITYLSQHLAHLKKTMKAGYMVNCVGDNRCFSFMPTRNDHTLADRVGRFVLKSLFGEYKEYSFLDRGSDERQYCSPGADLPVASLMRSKYGDYPEYHTSKDNLSLISPKALNESLLMFMACAYTIEHNATWESTHPCEPQLGKRGLYPSLGVRAHDRAVRSRMDFLAYCDGTRDTLEITDKIGSDFIDTLSWVQALASHKLIRECVPITHAFK